MAQENSSWGYDRIVGALANLGYEVSDQTVGNVLKRHGTAPAPKRSQSTTWKDFIQRHLAGKCCKPVERVWYPAVDATEPAGTV
jgi:hypothetical protein